MFLPDEEALVPCLFGRDLLKRMGIFLCQTHNVVYKPNELLNLKLNKAHMPNKNVVSALKLFNIFKCPSDSFTEAPIADSFTNNADITFSDKFVNSEVNSSASKLEFSVSKSVEPDASVIDDLKDCEERIGKCIAVVNLDATDAIEEYNEVILLVSSTEAEEFEQLVDINKKLSKKHADALKSLIFENYLKTKDGNRSLVVIRCKLD